MIDIVGKDCTGCSSCTQRCPVKCISMQENDEGFLYPVIDTDTCIGCNMCERVCPVLNPGTPREPIAAFAATNPRRDVVMKSSSGGVFHPLAADFIARGGAVFGARFTPGWQVEHACATTMEEAEAFMGSKYVQSSIGDTFAQAEQLLKQGVPVLFTGTPCQIAGLRLFLRKDYAPLLITVEVACHGVPSPMLWRQYVAEKCKTVGSEVTAVSFRDKNPGGWYGYRIAFTFANGRKDSKTNFHDDYMFGFLRNFTLRPSCFACPAKRGKSRSDITLGDFWGIEQEYPQLYKNEGVSFIFANSDAGSDAVKRLSLPLTAIEADKVIEHNPSLVSPTQTSPYYSTFWKEHEKLGIRALKKIIRRLRPSLLRRVLGKLKSLVGLH